MTKNISVVSYAPAPTGTTTMTDPRTFNHIGKVSGLKWSFNFPGGAYQCSGLLEIPPEQRESCLTYGRILRVFRGGPKYIWDGNIDSAVQTPKGWEFTAHGIGAQGDDFTADFPIPIMDNITGVVRNPWTLQGPLTAAYGRGLRWHQFSSFTDGWLDITPTPDSMTITDFLNSTTSRKGLGWYVARDGLLTIGPWPTTQECTRLLVSKTQIPRTLLKAVNTIWVYYQDGVVPTPIVAGHQAYADGVHTLPQLALSHGVTMLALQGVDPNVVAKYWLTDVPPGGTGYWVPAITETLAGLSSGDAVMKLVKVQNAAAAQKYGVIEETLDLSSSGIITETQAEQGGNFLLGQYGRTLFTGSFVLQQGDLLSMGGVPVDIALEQAATVCRLMLTSSLVAEVNADTVAYTTGTAEYDVDNEALTLTPYNTFANNFMSILAATATTAAATLIRPKKTTTSGAAGTVTTGTTPTTATTPGGPDSRNNTRYCTSYVMSTAPSGSPQIGDLWSVPA